MNENIDLTKILKDCPKGFELYSSVYGKVKFVGIDNNPIYFWIDVITEDGMHVNYTSKGKVSLKYNGECTLFPSKDQRDWSKITAPWYKKEKFNPDTLKPFDKVLACFTEQSTWCCGLFSYFAEDANLIVCCGEAYYKYCIPYNEETKHLLGTDNEAPEYYRYWEE